jgi:hypothetical protein
VVKIGQLPDARIWALRRTSNVLGQDGPHIEEAKMYPTMIQALGADRIREWHERAARDRLVSQARRARREAAPIPAEPRLRLGFRWPARRTAAPGTGVVTHGRGAPRPVAAGEHAVADQAMTQERAGVADDRQPVGGRAA